MQQKTERATAQDTRELAKMYRSYRTGNELLRHMLRERADDLDKEADEMEDAE